MDSVVRAFWNRWLGDRGEREAARFLRKQGMKVLTRAIARTRARSISSAGTAKSWSLSRSSRGRKGIQPRRSLPRNSDG